MSKQRFKVLVYMAVLLWVAAFTQMLVNQFFMKEDRIMEAFANTDTNIIESGLELTADYGNEILSEEDKRKLIKKIANGIGLDNEYAVTTSHKENSQTTKGEKAGKNAKTTIQIVTMQDEKDISIKQYIIVRLSIYERTESVIQYKKILEQIMEEQGVTRYQTLLRFNGFCDGELTEVEKREAVNEMLKNLQAKVVGEYSEDGLLNVYAYTGVIGAYLTVDQRRVNVNVAVTYDEQENCTNIYLATPILNGDY